MLPHLVPPLPYSQEQAHDPAAPADKNQLLDQAEADQGKQRRLQEKESKLTADFRAEAQRRNVDITGCSLVLKKLYDSGNPYMVITTPLDTTKHRSISAALDAIQGKGQQDQQQQQGQQPQPRPRGRPRKEKVQEEQGKDQQQQVPKGRGRGRPRKSSMGAPGSGLGAAAAAGGVLSGMAAGRTGLEEGLDNMGRGGSHDVERGPGQWEQQLQEEGENGPAEGLQEPELDLGAFYRAPGAEEEQQRRGKRHRGDGADSNQQQQQMDEGELQQQQRKGGGEDRRWKSVGEAPPAQGRNKQQKVQQIAAGPGSRGGGLVQGEFDPRQDFDAFLQGVFDKGAAAEGARLDAVHSEKLQAVQQELQQAKVVHEGELQAKDSELAAANEAVATLRRELSSVQSQLQEEKAARAAAALGLGALDREQQKQEEGAQPGNHATVVALQQQVEELRGQNQQLQQRDEQQQQEMEELRQRHEQDAAIIRSLNLQLASAPQQQLQPMPGLGGAGAGQAE